MSTALMRQMIAAVDMEYYDSVTRALLKSGAMHFIKVRELKTPYIKKLDSVAPKVNITDIQSARRRIESLLALIRIDPVKKTELDVKELKPPKIEEAGKEADRLSGDIEKVREKQRQIQQEFMRLTDVLRQLETSSSLSPDIMKQGSRFLSFYSGAVEPEERETFIKEVQNVPAVAIPLDLSTGGECIVIALKRNEAAVKEIMERFRFREMELEEEALELSKEDRGKIEARLGSLKEEQRKLKESVEDLVEEKKETLLSYWKNLRLNELYNTIENNYGKTSHTVLFAGWVPKSMRKMLDKTIREACDNSCYIEWRRPEEAVGFKGMDAPVEFTNPKVLKPFQMLVENYAIPQYGTFDPTPVVAVAYLLMFGMMFGDAGHGAVLLLTGIFGAWMKRGESIARLFQLIIWCGASAIIFGVLFGAYFGMGWFPPVWFDFHGAVTGHAHGGFVNDIYGILIITIYFGIAVIGVGLIINWINCLRKKNWVKLVLDKTGILGGWMYGAGIYTAYYFASHDFTSLPPGSLLFWILGVPALLFFLKPIVEFIRERREHGKEFDFFTLIDVLMEWIVEMLEVFSGYLSNTLSFMRVAGLGIAHVSLMTAFFQIASMVGDGSYTIGSYGILILGNLLVIVLEGLSAGIQSLRLNYYEFFSKHFSGSGIAYTPVSLKRAEYGG